MAIKTAFPTWLCVYVDNNVLLSADLRAHLYVLWGNLSPVVQNRLGLLLVQLSTWQNEQLHSLSLVRPGFAKDFGFFRHKQTTKILAQKERDLLKEEALLIDDILNLLEL